MANQQTRIEGMFQQPQYDTFVEVILPLAIPKTYTYAVPFEHKPFIKVGMRVEVQFGKSKLYAAIVAKVTQEAPKDYLPKPILTVLDKTPIVTDLQLIFWKWIAAYYSCNIGEVMYAALPNGLKLSSETKLMLSQVFDGNMTPLSDKEYLIAEALTLRPEITIDDARKIINQKTIYPIINSLLEKKVIYLQEELKSNYKPKKVACVKLKAPFSLENSDSLNGAFDLIKKGADRQLELLMGYLSLAPKKPHVTRAELCKLANTSTTTLKNLERKGIFEIYQLEISRIKKYDDELIEKHPLTTQQSDAIEGIKENFKEKNIVLLHGVTGSGKTRVYIELIQEAISKGEQVLYLLPEIALTTQVVQRLQRVFGDDIAIYHSKINNSERVEVWKKSLKDIPVILSARSGIFLPFQNLSLIIVDEEHDPSFKQTEPNPRYNARDMAVLLAKQYEAKVILGTATPSIESYSNATSGKYGLVEMTQRFGGMQLPEIVIVDAKKEMINRTMKSHFTSQLLDELKEALKRGEQAILFQNRRGYAPHLICKTCGWNMMCSNCDVGLTYHKMDSSMRCHLCGHRREIPKNCSACGSDQLNIKGFGTEKIEDELKIYLPEARIGRMDFDAVRTKNAYNNIIRNFELHNLDILVGTQMVTKGLDFDNVGLVGVLSADNLLFFPDFRSTERAFQLMTQVSGRAGRKKKRGKVLIQAFNTEHPVLKEVYDNDYHRFYKRELKERNDFLYPPFFRLIKITLRHKKRDMLNTGAVYFCKILKKELGGRVIGPAVPNIPRVRNMYIMDVMIKLERKSTVIKSAKRLIQDTASHLRKQKGLSSIRINIDVDPY